MTDSLAVELRNVSKVHAGGIKAVDGVTLQVPPGRIVALLGPSGSGKTTTLRLINRLEEASGGQVLVRGEDILRQRPEALRRSIGYVIQEGGLFPHCDVATNVATVPRLLRWPRRQVRLRVGEVLDMVGLPQATFGRRMPAQLSGGQRQRVGVARALAADPDILLMDEPFGALDPGTREAIQDEFLRLHARLRKAVVLVTHDVAEAGKLAEEIVVLDHGKIVQRGSLRDLLLRPAGDAVRSFLGAHTQGLALEALRLGQLLPELPAVPVAADSLRLSPDLPLAQVLVTLAEADEHATVLVGEDARHAYRAQAIRAMILTDLRATQPMNGQATAAPSPAAAGE
jgi:osmoprotectant transport system ATP-binding protein